TANPFFNAHKDRIVALAARHRLPALYEFRDFVEAGGFMCYGADNRDVYHRVATYVDRILKGAKPADLPVEQPTKLELVINLKTGQGVGSDDPAVGAGASGPGDRVTRARPTRPTPSGQRSASPVAPCPRTIALSGPCAPGWTPGPASAGFCAFVVVTSKGSCSRDATCRKQRTTADPQGGGMVLTIACGLAITRPPRGRSSCAAPR